MEPLNEYIPLIGAVSFTVIFLIGFWAYLCFFEKVTKQPLKGLMGNTSFSEQYSKDILATHRPIKKELPEVDIVVIIFKWTCPQCQEINIINKRLKLRSCVIFDHSGRARPNEQPPTVLRCKYCNIISQLTHFETV